MTKPPIFSLKQWHEHCASEPMPMEFILMLTIPELLWPVIFDSSASHKEIENQVNDAIHRHKELYAGLYTVTVVMPWCVARVDDQRRNVLMWWRRIGWRPNEVPDRPENWIPKQNT